MVGKRSSGVELILRYAADGSITIYPDPPDYGSSAKAQTQHRDRVSPVIVLVTSITASLLSIGGGKQLGAPATISYNYGFVVCSMFAFSCASSAMFLHNKPQAARVFRLSAIVWFSSAVLLSMCSFLCNRFS